MHTSICLPHVCTLYILDTFQAILLSHFAILVKRRKSQIEIESVCYKSEIWRTKAQQVLSCFTDDRKLLT